MELDKGFDGFGKRFINRSNEGSRFRLVFSLNIPSESLKYIKES